MAELVDQSAPDSRPETPSQEDLVNAVRQVLQDSPEPLTPAKIRSSLPPALRSVSPEALNDLLTRQASAQVFHQFPRYRSQQERFWDRPMEVHLASLVRETVREKALAWPDLRRKLPDYARTLAESTLDEQVARGQLHRHPPLSARSGPRFGVQPPDPKEFLQGELSAVFHRLEKLGFTQDQIRAGALELLHEDEWAPTPPPARSRKPEPHLAGTSGVALAATGEGPQAEQAGGTPPAPTGPGESHPQ